MLLFSDKIALHVSRPVRWDSDHVVLSALSTEKLAPRLGMTPDAVLVDVEAAMESLGEATGRVVREDITNRIFERFCVGK